MVGIKYIVLIILLVFLFVLFNLLSKSNKLLNQGFYNYKDIYPQLQILKGNNKIILDEIYSQMNHDTKENSWKAWPEQICIKAIQNGILFPSSDLVKRLKKIVKNILKFFP